MQRYPVFPSENARSPPIRAVMPTTNNAGRNTTTLNQTVNRGASSTSIASSLNPSSAGQSVTFTATVIAPLATGTVSFLDAGTALPGCSTVALNGTQASCAVPSP